MLKIKRNSFVDKKILLFSIVSEKLEGYEHLSSLSKNSSNEKEAAHRVHLFLI